LFSLYAFIAHALWTEGVFGHPVRGAAHPRIRAAPSPRRWRARCGRRLGTAALRQGTQMVLQHSQRHHGAERDRRRGCDRSFRRYNLALGAGLSKVSGKLFRIGHLGDLNDLMVLGALAGAEMAMRDVGIDLTLGSGVAAAQAHFRKTIMAKEKEPTEQE